ncbi:MAG: TRAP transporter large permease subunit [Bilophila wadsworthia]
MDTLSILLISLVVLLLFGVPVYMVLISSTMISLFVFSSLPLTVIHNALFEGLNSFPLLAIPCFVVAGTLMEQGGVTGQIIDVVKMLVGRMYGGSGSRRSWLHLLRRHLGFGAGDVAAVGTLLIPSAPGIHLNTRRPSLLPAEPWAS